MIIYLLISAALSFVPALTRILPSTGPAPISIPPALDQLLTGFVALNQILPLSEAFVCLGIYLQAWVVLLGWKALEWIYKLIPLKAT